MEAKKDTLRARIAAQLPTATELAQIAANLAKAGTEIDAPKLVGDALNIWAACQKAIAECVQQNAERIENPEPPSIEKRARQFPMPLDKFLKEFVEGKTRSDWYGKFRSYLCESIRVSRALDRRHRDGISDEEALEKEPTVGIYEVGELLGKYRKNGLSERQYSQLAELFPRWLKQQRDAEATEKARRNAKKRWSKDKKKK